MSSIYWPNARPGLAKEETLRHKFYSFLAILIIWSISLTVLLFGLPFIALQAMRRRSK